MTSVLVVDDNDDDAVLIGHALARAGLQVQVTREETTEGVARALAAGPVDVVICDYNLPSVRAEDLLDQVRGTTPTCRSCSSPAKSARKWRPT
ncbi:hypothetical protein Aab01nite_72960 [Paractinoplanes abujensis]|uniref:CheY-like chemotaxis protein n=1 Tax=Paractinoplanes abujensis TaxID=882441 RepID=A0A7W7G476_9ACTN|nr:hypothetical protein [Actinoplanes abujensis]MBB4694975.1 CheY-like chemotaxis protein [Actinoplanes abujensis]GID23706.1 hypothetical protein Aab01nite_72960 [Actinoplanes abujensis]